MNLLDIANSNPKLRGPQTIIGSDNKEYRIYICQGCLDCHPFDLETRKTVEYYPHILAMEVAVVLRRFG